MKKIYNYNNNILFLQALTNEFALFMSTRQEISDQGYLKKTIRSILCQLVQKTSVNKPNNIIHEWEKLATRHVNAMNRYISRGCLMAS